MAAKKQVTFRTPGISHAYKTANRSGGGWEVHESRDTSSVYWSSHEEAAKDIAELTDGMRNWDISMETREQYGSTSAILVCTGWRDATPKEIVAIEKAVCDEKTNAAMAKQKKKIQEEEMVERLRKERPELFH